MKIKDVNETTPREDLRESDPLIPEPCCIYVQSWRSVRTVSGYLLESANQRSVFSYY